MRVYIETTIPSYLAARPARDVVQAGRQEITRDWWDFQRHKHELFTSQLVTGEAALGEVEMARKRLEILAEIPLLDLSTDALALAERLSGSGILPSRATYDGAHIALATVHKMDILLTWNCRHIANAFIFCQLRRFMESKGYSLPALYTPEQFLQNPYE